MIPAELRFWEKVAIVDDENSCWLWLASCRPDGYGQFALYDSTRAPQRWKEGAHRFAWKLINGDVPEDQQVLHRCDMPPCVRPSHLFLGDGSTNMQDMIAKGRQKYVGCPRKLSDSDVAEIRDLRHQGVLLQEIADRFGVSFSYVSQLASGLYRNNQPGVAS